MVEKVNLNVINDALLVTRVLVSNGNSQHARAEPETQHLSTEFIIKGNKISASIGVEVGMPGRAQAC